MYTGIVQGSYEVVALRQEPGLLRLALQLDLVRNPDILADVGAKRLQRPAVLVGFALETANLEQAARDKLYYRGQ